MVENPKNVVLPQKSNMNGIKNATMYLLSTGVWKAKVQGCADIIQNAATPNDIISTLARPYRLSAVNFHFTNMSRDDLSVALVDAWTSSENPNMDSDMTKAQAVRLFQICNPEKMMCEADYEVYKQLPDELIVYRGLGTLNADNIKALSWTLNVDRAKWFAKRFNFSNAPLKVYRAKIKKKYVFAYCNDRNEGEVIVDYHKLQNIELLTE